MRPALRLGREGHYIVNEAATMSLPTDMPQFFYKGISAARLSAYDPDRWRGAGPSLDAANGPITSRLRIRRWADAAARPAQVHPPSLGTSGTLRRHALENSWTGFLPWRIAEMSSS